MNDFDFEELDKAVSDLAVKTQDEHSDVGLEAAPVSLAIARSDPRKPEPVVVKATVPRSEPQPTESTSIPVATPQKHSARLSDTKPRSRGAFMDIVPPTSRKPGGRVGVFIQPVNKPEDVMPEEPQKQSEPEAPASEATVEPKPEVPTSQPDTPETNIQKKPQEVSWPDPLDFGAGEKDDADKKSLEQTQPEPPVTPFLAEAKVEKRPLGAFSNFKPAVEPKAEEAQTPEEPKPHDELTPEKDGTFKEPQPEKEKPAEPESPEVPAPQEEKSSKPTESEKPDLHNQAMMSIPQQYHTEAKLADKAARPVFDTKEYHPPLAEAAGHEHRGGGSMWGKIFIAFVVVVLLAVAGYFAYLYVAR